MSGHVFVERQWLCTRRFHVQGLESPHLQELLLPTTNVHDSNTKKVSRSIQKLAMLVKMATMRAKFRDFSSTLLSQRQLLGTYR